MFNCKYCNKDCKNNGGLSVHEPFCKNNPNKIKRISSRFKYGPWNKGLTKETDIRLKYFSENLHQKYINGDIIPSWKGKHHTIEQREYMSKVTKRRHENGWDNKCGRAPKIKYHSDIAGDVTLDGSWELSVAKYLDERGIEWRRNKRRFKYVNLHNKESYYKPDFYLVNENIYIEVKGYETDLDRCKWKQFPKNETLKVWKKDDLLKLDIL